VPAVAQPLRIRDVRVAAANPAGGDITGSGGTLGQESDIVGLVADLAARPLKGSGFSAGRVAMINGLGALDAVVGNAGDCVRVDGSSGPCGPPQTSFIDGDIPAGIVDGANTRFTLSATPSPASSLAVYRNGLLQAAGADYTVVNNNVVQFSAATVPQPGDALLATYRLASAGNGTPQLFPASQVLCSGVGAGINTTSFSSLGTCTIPAGMLNGGDRIQIQFDLVHQGTSAGFSGEVRWGGAAILHRDAAAGDAQVSGRVDAGFDQTGAHVSAQSWGTVLPFSATVASAPGNYSQGMVIDFEGKLSAAGDTLTLSNFSMVRLP